MVSTDQGKPVTLVLLDMSAVFYTVDPNCTFLWVQNILCLSRKVVERFQTYLEQFSQRVSVHGILSDVQFLLSGVPQTSVLGLWFSQCIPVSWDHCS